MNFEQTPFDIRSGSYGRPVPLAHQPPFKVGPIEVEPALRTLEGPAGRVANVEPLVMFVLIALHQAGAAPCSRDDLVATCWERRLVGDDAVNRVISHLRRHLAAASGSAVSIETIAKVGYRLHVESADGGQSTSPTTCEAPAPSTREHTAWRAITLAALVAALAGGTAIAVQPAPGGPKILTIETSKGAGPASRGFADALTTDVARLSGASTRLTFFEAGDGPEAAVDIIMQVSLERGEQGTAANLRLVERKSRAIVWSQQFEDSSGSLSLLRQRTATGIAETLRCALERSTGELGDAVSMRLYFGACAAVEANDWPRASTLAREIVALRPEAAAGWACLAMATLNASSRDPAAQKAAAIEAKRHAEHALAIDSHSGLAYQALAMAEEALGRPNPSLLARGVAADPEHPGLLARHAMTLFNLGYGRAATDVIERATTIAPSNRFVHAWSAYLQTGSGDRAAGERALSFLETLNPDDPISRPVRANMLVSEPDPRAALARLRASPPPDPHLAAGAAKVLEWRIDKAGFDWSQFDRLAEAAFAANPENAWHMAQRASFMGDHARALAWLERAPLAGSWGKWWPLFWPEAAALRRDRRFFAKMHALGLVEHWRREGRWPDFCAAPGLAYDCAAEARRLSSRKSAVARPTAHRA